MSKNKKYSTFICDPLVSIYTLYIKYDVYKGITVMCMLMIKVYNYPFPWRHLANTEREFTNQINLHTVQYIYIILYTYDHEL